MTVVTVQGIAEREVYSWRLTACPGSVARWRRVAAETVAMLGGDQDAVALARLGLSELLSNVVKHVADRRCLLVIAAEGENLRVTVQDRSVEVPAVMNPRTDEECGRGLWLLREMAKDLGYICLPGGKAVWFRCPLVRGSEGGVCAPLGGE
ncbi:ATP-binding protein [Streptomyces sp. MP131-18]|uniref:ATP-binding protein n=1 Tax=Streptomyces sp. MP131-18 TaxID=1857892 RepID=UPI00097BAE0F|nr:ATP-binding protein [Streptomyces sp. MP131-18]ONK10065.1 hypothetical protein STBA_07720 [Streptomyces sp. MP131-18]